MKCSVFLFLTIIFVICCKTSERWAQKLSFLGHFFPMNCGKIVITVPYANRINAKNDS